MWTRRFAAWQAGVGSPAADGTTLTPVDQPSLAAALFPREEGLLRFGGEGPDELTEYYRSKHLGQLAAGAVLSAAGNADTRSRLFDTARDELAAVAAAEFAAWLPTQRSNPPELDELAGRATELAKSWSFDSPPQLYYTCSPHRVALNVQHLREYHGPRTAAELEELLPDWITWLATRSGTAPELVERSRPYARGEIHPEVGDDDNYVNYHAQVAE